MWINSVLVGEGVHRLEDDMLVGKVGGLGFEDGRGV